MNDGAAALQRVIDEMRVVLDTVPAAVWIARDPECSHIDANRLGAELLRRPRATNVSLTGPVEERPGNFRVVKDGRELSGDELPVQAAARKGTTITGFEEDVLFEDGAVRHLLGNAAPILGADGRVQGSVAAFIDITERKRAEDALRARDAQFRALLEELYSGVALIDSAGRFSVVNRRFLEMFGLSRDANLPEVNAQDWAAWQVYGEDERLLELDEHPVRKAVRTQRSVRNELVGVRRPGGGDLVWMQVSAEPLVGQAGAVEHVICTYHEVTSLRRAEEELRRSEAALREADRRKDDFVAMVSHELRNPLAPIRNAAYILSRAELTEPLQRSVKTIERQVDHLTRLVDDLLDVTRIVHGKIALRRERLDLNDVAAHVVADFRVPLHDRGVALNIVLADPKVFVEADATRLAQIVSNLLQNALKFTSKGDAVTVTVRRVGGMAEVEVVDTGLGIDPSLIPTIFDPFVQGERTLGRSERGLGLGLALVKGLTELHGGSVQVESEGPGKGSRFVVRLPVATVATASPNAAAGAWAPRGARRVVLVVDDDHDCADSLAELLRVLGHDVDVAYDGRTAIEKVRARPPNTVLCDIGMPEVGGVELVFALRAMAPDTMRIIAVTGHAQPEDVRRALAAGCDAHVPKPADIREIEKLLEWTEPPGATGG